VLTIGSVVVNVPDVRRAAEFWAAALDYVPRYPVEDDWAILQPRPAGGPASSEGASTRPANTPATTPANLSLNLGETAPDAVPHVHLDLYATDQVAEVERLVGLGATRVEDWPYPKGEDVDYVVLADPYGNVFCVVDASGG
jgi:hypothetical protein